VFVVNVRSCKVNAEGRETAMPQGHSPLF